jgi:hypothetical protein
VWGIQLPKRHAAEPDQHFYIPDVAQAGGTMTINTILSTTEPTSIVPGSDLGRVRVEWWRDDRQLLVVNKVVQPPYFVDSVATSTFMIPTPPEPGSYEVRVSAGETKHEVASGMVTLTNDVAPPEITLLPVRGVEAKLVCDAGAIRADVTMKTTGWYDESFTLSGRVMDASGVEVARSAADVEFPPVAPRTNLLHQAHYSLPFDALPEINDGPLALELLAYQWQQLAERIVARNFVDANGTVVGSQRLPLLVSPACHE